MDVTQTYATRGELEAERQRMNTQIGNIATGMTDLDNRIQGLESEKTRIQNLMSGAETYVAKMETEFGSQMLDFKNKAEEQIKVISAQANIVRDELRQIARD